ncbi:hypothetical protein A3A39_01665 [Candidatus Kaiserbacteria bacterium RIFCSPLOWO2_01_FULL_54_13]|uniref:Uncharacterized protein n=1 Tax=Candidatus Kaiserbacteria bacterium RIFCSPLOWO2_01_FULL_54_13 TaxID=1798512 RepID=A0A1F6F3X2_9BACT|nr:MAG: hypothetical protein A3A39_01665 [Candidatus Kaiserbacteria bacterium RIFCSPLOWO2_01_FULL_54_13]
MRIKRPVSRTHGSGLTWWESLSPETKVAALRPYLENNWSNADICEEFALASRNRVASIRERWKRGKKKSGNETRQKSTVLPKLQKHTRKSPIKRASREKKQDVSSEETAPPMQPVSENVRQESVTSVPSPPLPFVENPRLDEQAGILLSAMIIHKMEDERTMPRWSRCWWPTVPERRGGPVRYLCENGGLPLCEHHTRLLGNRPLILYLTSPYLPISGVGVEG